MVPLNYQEETQRIATGEVYQVVPLQLLGHDQCLTQNCGGGVEPTSRQQVPGDVIEQLHGRGDLDIQATGVPGAAENMRQQSLAVFPFLWIFDIFWKGGSDRC